jgi:phosphonopyruvate decarboxylase
MDSTGRPYALIMKKGVVAPYKLGQTADFKTPVTDRVGNAHTRAGVAASRHDVLRELVVSSNVSDAVLIASTGFSGRELYAIDDRPNQLYMVGSMGCAASIGLGLSLVRPDKKIVVIDGDGATLMRMGNMATVGAYAEHNYFHLLLDNHVHESTGGQATVSSAVDFPAIAAACGYRSIVRASGDSHAVGRLLNSKSPAFMHIETDRGIPDGLPRPSVKPADVARRLMQHLGVNTPWMSA